MTRACRPIIQRTLMAGLSSSRQTQRPSTATDAGTCSRISVTTGGIAGDRLAGRSVLLSPSRHVQPSWGRIVTVYIHLACSDISRIIRNINPQATLLQYSCFGSLVCFRPELPVCSSGERVDHFVNTKPASGDHYFCPFSIFRWLRFAKLRERHDTAALHTR